MKTKLETPSLILALFLFFSGAMPAFAQYDSAADSGITCWQCPVCGYTVSLTPTELSTIDPYLPCPACYSAYAYSFVQVQCPLAAYEQTRDEAIKDGGLATNGSQINISTGLPIIGPAFTGTASNQNDAATAAKGKILMVLSPQQYKEDELNVPRDYFLSQGYAVVLASLGTETATGMSGGTASVDLDIKSAQPSDYRAIVFVGGDGIYTLKLNQDANYQGLAKAALSQKKIVGAICLAPWILADAGLLKGKKATASDTDRLRSEGAIVSDEAVVRDGSIITGNGPSAALEFAQAVVAAIEESDGSSKEQGLTESEMRTALRVPLGTDTTATTSSAPPAKWKCTVCGYIYDPEQNNGVPFEQLPSTWQCPCGAPKAKFVKI
jgi:protease I